jgi:tRNA A64-2'-O-ribosylphosphate transferase
MTHPPNPRPLSSPQPDPQSESDSESESDPYTAPAAPASSSRRKLFDSERNDRLDDESDTPPPDLRFLNIDTTSSSFPRTLADLQYDPSQNTIYPLLRAIRRSTLSIPNRLRSIIDDSTFATRVSKFYDLPLIANERCGSWYIPPDLKGGSVYFKSTDGHHGQWRFSLRRLNLQLLKVMGEKDGAVVVDSTRRGKTMPDALMKTLPIWVAVMNRVLFPDKEEWQRLQLPEMVGESEKSQIEARVEGWCEGFEGLGLDLEKLRKECKWPIKLAWTVHGEWSIESAVDEQKTQDTRLLVLCSASKRVRGPEASEGGYIQGAGDDSEGWSKGLTPQMFWKHRELLVSVPGYELPELIEDLLGREKGEEPSTRGRAVLIAPTECMYLGVGTNPSDTGFDMVISCSGKTPGRGERIRGLECREGKLGSRDLREKMFTTHDWVGRCLHRYGECHILVCCSTGKDLSVGVALALLCHFFDDSGNVLTEAPARVIDKTFVKQRLAWITSSKPDANPSRSTLQAVNSFLMERPK